MMLRGVPFAALCALLCSSDSAYASLKHANSDAFVKLADLTRSPSERLAHDVSAESFSRQSSFDLPFVRDGVDWEIDFSDGEVRTLITGQNNDNGMDFKSLGMHFHPESSKAKRGNDKGWFHSLFSRDADDRTDHGKQKLRSQADQKVPSTFSPLKPPSIPLAVKSPYISAWAPAGQLSSISPPNTAGNGGYLAGQFPDFWTTGYSADGDFRLGWAGFIRVDNTSYQWMGDNFGSTVKDGPDATQIAFSYTATRSMFQFEAGSVLFNVTFMTPVWPDDYLRQSLPMSYMHVELDRDSAKAHSVQLFTDIDERWSSAHVYDYQNYPMNMSWVDTASNNHSDTSIYFVQRTQPENFVEFRQRAEWGSAVYAMRKRAGMSSRNNNNIAAQREFLETGTVTYDHLPVGGPDNSFSYTVNFDNKTGGDDAIFGIGHMRIPYIQYIRPASSGLSGSSHIENRYGYWMSKYPKYEDAVAFFMSDFENALAHCKSFDAMIDSDSRAAVGGGQVGEQYAAITTLSVRQSFGGLEITVPYDASSGQFNANDPIIFLKEISSDGDIQTVDVFTPQFPLLTYLNPELLHDVMKPIFEYTESGLYPNKWCVHDLGFYPNATGHNDGKDEPMQVEESGNMILLSLHYAQLVGKAQAVAFVKAHYKILQQWAQFLMQDSLIPALQLSTDDFAGTLANQTNLALKGIEGIAAMEHIAELAGQTQDAAQYRNVSQTYIQAYYGYAINKNNTHVKLAYQNDNSWGTLYNLAFDRLLNLKLVAKEIYTKQDAFYPTKAAAYGTPLDSRYSWAKTDWQMWASATAASTSTRDFFINFLHKFVSDVETDAPLADLYETSNGDFPKDPKTPKIYFINRPVVGGHFMHLAMAKANKVNGVSSYEYGPGIQSHQNALATQSAMPATSDAQPQTPAQSNALGIVSGLLSGNKKRLARRSLH